MQEVLEAFVATYPSCEVFADLTNRTVDTVEEGYDLALRVRSPGDADMVARRLGTASTGLFVSTSADDTHPPPNRSCSEDVSVQRRSCRLTFNSITQRLP